MLEYLARRSSNRLVRINNHEHTDLQEYIGTYLSSSTGQLVFQDGVLVQALRQGHWVVLDELNLAPADVLEAMNRLLDENRELLVPETQEVIRPHPNFQLFATQNPAGAYAGRRVLSEAFRNRFLELDYEDIPVDELEIILSRRCSLPHSWVSKIVGVYRDLSQLRQRNRLFDTGGFATLRDLFRWGLRHAETVHELAENGFMLLAEKMRTSDEREWVKQIIQQRLSGNGIRIDIDEEALYRKLSESAAQADHSGIIWTKAMRRLYSLVRSALQYQEPVLMVGETGSGKTQVCKLLADLSESPLMTLNAHQNMETSDFIGAQRPNRRRESVQRELLKDLTRALEHIGVGPDANAAANQYNLLGHEQQTLIPETLRSEIAQKRGQLKILFEWQDGPLVRAMRAGHYFLLDEISLADDSVLERMNSVLDPERTVLLAEKGTADPLVTAADGFQFLATMNPAGDYGKKELSRALSNRFTEIWVPPTNDLEDANEIVREKLCDSAKRFAEGLVQFSAWFNSRFCSARLGTVSLRDLLAWVEFINIDDGSGADYHSVPQRVIDGAFLVFVDTLGANPSGDSAIGENVGVQRRTCTAELCRIFDFAEAAVKAQSTKITDTQDRFQIGPFYLEKGDLPCHQSLNFEANTTRINAMRVMRGLQLKKPILLEGSPGVGKLNGIRTFLGYTVLIINE